MHEAQPHGWSLIKRRSEERLLYDFCSRPAFYVVTISIAKAVLRFEIGVAFCGIASHRLDANCRKSDAGRLGGASS
ncbi:hypothetical protein NKH55_30575 [Mesorhizobium opportunistum]|uniref:hypothetical protein n=1 Tax=Mesorhizobium opportunistum TaxID=593909 RepID=UPI00333A6D0F